MSTDPMNTILEKRITAALADDVVSADLAGLIAETEATITRADATAEMEHTKALDPMLSPDAKAAREAMQDAEFARDRLRTVLPRLQARLTEVLEAEEFARWLPQQRAVEARRNELAAKLRELYLPFVEKIVPLMLEIETVDQEIWRVNQAAPYKAKTGAYLLHSVEHEARGPSASRLRQLQIMKDLRLPNWEGGELPVWPPHRPPTAAAIAPMPGGVRASPPTGGGRLEKSRCGPLRSVTPAKWRSGRLRRSRTITGHAGGREGALSAPRRGLSSGRVHSDRSAHRAAGSISNGAEPLASAPCGWRTPSRVSAERRLVRFRGHSGNGRMCCLDRTRRD
jgi:hypothetical protein